MMKKCTVQIVMTALLGALVVTVLTGCGKKGPPLAPIIKGNTIAAPTELKYTVSDNTIQITWQHRVDPENARIEPDAFEVFLATKTFEECEGCPFKFELVQTVPVPDMTYTMTIESGFRYYFRVQAVNSDKLRSGYSKTIQYESK